MAVWESIRQEKDGDIIVKSFEIEKVGNENNQEDTNNHFDETEFLQLKAAIDKAINEENVKTIHGTKTDTTKTNKE